MAPGPEAEDGAARLDALPVCVLPGGRRVHEARTWPTRRRGLGGLSVLPDGAGLRIVPCRSVHTAGMRFPLDLVWLDEEERVVRLDRDVAPYRLRTCLRARSVIEVAAGEGPLVAEAWAGRARDGGLRETPGHGG